MLQRWQKLKKQKGGNHDNTKGGLRQMPSCFKKTPFSTVRLRIFKVVVIDLPAFPAAQHIAEFPVERQADRTLQVLLPESGGEIIGPYHFLLGNIAAERAYSSECDRQLF